MVMAVAFTRYGRLYYLDPGPHSPRVGDKVLVPTDDGPEVAECIWAPEYVTDDVGALPVCAGLATDADLERDQRNRKRKAEAKLIAKRMVREHGLPMKVVAVDYTERRPDVDELVTIYFSAPQRVDFRALVRELARELRARIDLRQIGARDEARVQGGIGPCGRDLCCATFLKDFEPVSVRMAKDQDLPLNPLKISGACGRLMCCLKYEHPLYIDFKGSVPRLGAHACGGEVEPVEGTVVGYNVPADVVIIKDKETLRHTSCPKASVCGSRQEYEKAVGGGMRASPSAGPDPWGLSGQG
jgi:cell fate regulator YaaT (PSP1 superfamily)